MKRILSIVILTFLTSISFILVLYGTVVYNSYQAILVIIGFMLLLMDLGFIYYTHKKGIWSE